MFTQIFLSGNKKSQLTGAFQTSLTPTATCVVLSVWSEARCNNRAKKTNKKTTLMKRGIFEKHESAGLLPRLRGLWWQVWSLERLPTQWDTLPGFSHITGAEGPGLRREVGSLLHSNLLGCGWERLRPTVLTISPCSHEPHRGESEREREGKRYPRQICGQGISPEY